MLGITFMMKLINGAIGSPFLLSVINFNGPVCPTVFIKLSQRRLNCDLFNLKVLCYFCDFQNSGRI